MASMVRIDFALIVFLLFIWRIKRGFNSGIMREVVTILSGTAALVSVILLFFAISSYMEKAPSVFTLCVIGLVVIGIVFKLCSLIFRPILALSNVSVIGGFNKILGAVMGAAEAFALSCLLYHIINFILDYAGRYSL